MADKAQRVFGLDLMRAMAICMVLCSHILWIYVPEDGLIRQLFALFGFLGVEFFFVLSGFLIGRILYKIYMKDDFTISSVFGFLKRRWFRTLPNYYLVLLINIVITMSLSYSMPNLGLYFIFLHNGFSKMSTFFPESWSLSVEEWAYFLLPFSLLLFSFFFKPKNKNRFFLIITLFLIAVFIFFKIVYQSNHQTTTIDEWNVSLKAVMIYRLDAILTGVLTAWISINYANFFIKFKFILAMVGSFFMLFMYFGMGFLQILPGNHPFVWNVVYLPLTSLSVAFFVPFFSQLEITTAFIKLPVVFISKISYSIYLLHYSVLLQLFMLFFDKKNTTLLHLHFITALYLTTTVIVSYIFYSFYEKPIMDLRDKN
ncbi:acyltransferase [Flavobacterium paronense]|uniref:Acyltransferase family protein n=1 Tax=Flavobacterium paronense TaxID=1392775 RepID=A0ABV5GDF3_9FLAO|nr:acyltransferase [Flavobacterium paronense]MDN3677955.1 acyltransferase [Flavobacterium paronense]